jgi:putative oxygen-independent coproporphyrinogen III oxidase
VQRSLYVHVPFCATRCGYCDFNTYTATELGDDVHRETFHRVLIDEIAQQADQWANVEAIETVFFGGGTPTLIGSSALTEILSAVRDHWGLAPDAEITTEANPDSVDQVMLDELRSAGFTRISFGMQSAAPHVLRTLDRTHTPGMATTAARWAREAGFEHVSVDLIYGTPGETDDDVRTSLDAALAAGVDHLSAYSLIVEEGTALSRRMQRGEVAQPDDDVAADRYELIDDALAAAGMGWYEISNWARPGGVCRHNMTYWSSGDWWGIGPGAHSHVQGVRWWNTKHPASYAAAVAQGETPLADQEILTDDQRTIERIMLGIRQRTGVPADAVSPAVMADLVADGLVQPSGDRVVLTRSGRLLADRVLRALTATPGEPTTVP